MKTLLLSWIPGSMTRVTVNFQNESKELHVDRVALLFGRPALASLYLTGHYAPPLGHSVRFQDL